MLQAIVFIALAAITVRIALAMLSLPTIKSWREQMPRTFAIRKPPSPGKVRHPHESDSAAANPPCSDRSSPQFPLPDDALHVIADRVLPCTVLSVKQLVPKQAHAERSVRPPSGRFRAGRGWAAAKICSPTGHVDFDRERKPATPDRRMSFDLQRWAAQSLAKIEGTLDQAFGLDNADAAANPAKVAIDQGPDPMTTEATAPPDNTANVTKDVPVAAPVPDDLSGSVVPAVPEVEAVDETLPDNVTDDVRLRLRQQQEQLASIGAQLGVLQQEKVGDAHPFLSYPSGHADFLLSTI